MLITFKSKSSPDLLMYEEHAQRLLEMLKKNPGRGVITAAEAAGALDVLEKEIADSKLRQQAQAEAKAKAKEDAQEEGDDDDEENTKRSAQVDFSTRAYPLLEMLRTAQQRGHDITWGV
jgi:hypothetical protein